MGMKVRYPGSKELFLHTLRDEQVDFYLRKLKELSRETYAHSVRVGRFLDLGYDFGFDASSLSALRFALFLHDVGKLFIPEGILCKKGGLTDDEMKRMREHPRYGFLLLQDFDPLVRKAVVAHHEYQKGPYPRSGKERRKIARGFERRVPCLEASCLGQMIAVADKYDALIHARAYKGRLSLDEAISFLEYEFTGDRKYFESVLKRVC